MKKLFNGKQVEMDLEINLNHLKLMNNGVNLPD